MANAAYDYEGMTDVQVFLSDYKDYDVNGHLFGIGNITCKQTEVEDMIIRMLAVMPEVIQQKGRQMIFGLIDVLIPNPDYTDTDKTYIKQGSYFIY
ncbi:MAG: hypothetical protein K5856_08065 [Bacteroidaceae bacterium]|nr:hypothetical protein [Bacteroidaceae bacterium]